MQLLGFELNDEGNFTDETSVPRSWPPLVYQRLKQQALDAARIGRDSCQDRDCGLCDLDRMANRPACTSCRLYRAFLKARDLH